MRGRSQNTTNSHLEDTPMDRITAIENEIEATMVRLQQLASSPAVFEAEGLEWETIAECSLYRGLVQKALFRRVDALNHQRLALMGVPNAA